MTDRFDAATIASCDCSKRYVRPIIDFGFTHLGLHSIEAQIDPHNHASIRTTQLYDRRPDEVNLDEVERISI